jgi:hypothetical protein
MADQDSDNRDGKVDGLPWDMTEKGVEAHERGVNDAGRSIFWDAVGCIPGGGMVGAAVSSIEGEACALTGDNAGASSHFGDAAMDVATGMIPFSSYPMLAADCDAYFKRRDGRMMPDQAPTASEQISNKLWDWMSR